MCFFDYVMMKIIYLFIHLLEPNIHVVMFVLIWAHFFLLIIVNDVNNVMVQI